MSWSWKQIHWPQPFDHHEALGFVQRLAADEDRGPVIFEARAEAGVIRHLIGSGQTSLSAVRSTLRRLVPDATVTKLTDSRVPVERSGRVRIRQRNLGLSLDTDGTALRALYAALSQATGAGDVLVMQVILGASVPPQVVPPKPQDPNLSLFDLALGGSRPASSETRRGMVDKLGQYRFRAIVRLGVSAASPVRRRLLVFSVLAALRQLQTGSTRIDLQSERPELVDQAIIPARKPLRLTAEEALCVLGWPTGERQLPGMPPLHPKRLAPPHGYAVEKSARPFAITSAAGPCQPVGITIEDALRHTHILGPTGVGKSTVLLNLIASDVAAGRSVVVIDPKGDLARDALTVIPEHRAEEVVVLDPTAPDPVGLNPFADAGVHAPLVADRILAVFRALFPSAFGPATADAIHASLLTLAAKERSTLADLPRLLTDDRFRGTFTARLDDLALLQFWAQYEARSAAARAAAIGPVLNRLRQFLLRPSIRAVLDQPSPRFDLRDLFTKRRILVVSLNRGLLGPVAAELLGSLLVSQLWQLILARADIPQADRHPVSIYLDETQMFVRQETDLGEALEQSRSMGAAWHLAHQHRGQLPTVLLSGIAANTRNKIQFQADPAEAAAVARYSSLAPEDFMKLAPFDAYVDLLAGGRQTGWFSVSTLPQPAAISDPDTILIESRARYGRRPENETEKPITDDSAESTTSTKSLELAASLTDIDTHDSEPIGRRRKDRP